MQSNDLARQILEGKPYPIRGIFALGMNMRMFSDSNLVKSALEEVEFFVDSELFLTDTAKYADIILPVCSSLEREEFKCYSGGYAGYTQQVIKPLGEARSDVDVLCEIARRLHVGDEVLEGGYDSCVSYMISNLSVTVEEMKANRGFRRVPEFKPYEYGSNIERGLPTKTGKFELKSELIAAHPEWGLDALPTFTEPCDMKEKEEYPFVLCAGARKSNMMHSRLHDVKWLRSLSPNPTVEINMEDAKMLGIKNGDEVLISTERAEISAQASITMTVLQGEVFMYHGYREADTNSLMRYDKLDPYSGFPAYRSVCCCIRKGK